MAVVILSVADDHHALLVREALLRLGADCLLVTQESLPGGGDLLMSGPWDDPFIRCGAHAFRPSEIDAFWNRRRPQAFNFPAWSHPADHTHISESFQDALTGLCLLLDERFAVNPVQAARIGANKIMQLGLAEASGLSISRTIVGNDVAAVAGFIAAVDTVCAKPSAGYGWRDGDWFVRTLTTVLPSSFEPDPDTVGLMPLIYQAYVPKQFEARITVFGRTVIATRIDLAEEPTAQQDWRLDRNYLGRLSPIRPPEAVSRSCLDLLKRLGLRFGTFDFVITPDGQWVFLEVNQAGQFAWQEQFDTDTAIIEPFARFLAAADDAWEWNPADRTTDLSFASLRDGVMASRVCQALMARPVPRHDRFSADESCGAPGR